MITANGAPDAVLQTLRLVFDLELWVVEGSFSVGWHFIAKDKMASFGLNTLHKCYKIATDFSNVQNYVSITLTHNKLNHTINVSTPGYAEKALLRFNRTTLRCADSYIIYVPPWNGKF